MTELKHWLDDASDSDEFERSVLRSGLALEPPPGAEDAVFASVLGALANAAILPIAASVNATTAKASIGGASKAAAVWLGVGKGFVVGLAIYGAAAGASEVAARFSAPAPHATATPKPGLPSLPPLPEQTAVNTRSEQPLDAPMPMPTPTSSSPDSARGASVSPSALSTAAELPSVAAFPEPVSGARPSQLQAEAAALRSARAELRAGKLADAFATLEASRRQFPAPELYQEREALLIELLYRSGQVANARTRAEAFVARFPESPHAAAISQFSVH